MDELIPILAQMAQKTWMDYFAVFAPIVLSIVAIGISISSIRKQNKIALFEKRYELYAELCDELQVMSVVNSLMSLRDCGDLPDKWMVKMLLSAKIVMKGNKEEDTSAYWLKELALFQQFKSQTTVKKFDGDEGFKSYYAYTKALEKEENYKADVVRYKVSSRYIIDKLECLLTSDASKAYERLQEEYVRIQFFAESDTLDVAVFENFISMKEEFENTHLSSMKKMLKL